VAHVSIVHLGMMATNSVPMETVLREIVIRRPKKRMMVFELIM